MLSHGLARTWETFELVIWAARLLEAMVKLFYATSKVSGSLMRTIFADTFVNKREKHRVL